MCHCVFAWRHPRLPLTVKHPFLYAKKFKTNKKGHSRWRRCLPEKIIKLFSSENVNYWISFRFVRAWATQIGCKQRLHVLAQWPVMEGRETKSEFRSQCFMQKCADSFRPPPLCDHYGTGKTLLSLTVANCNADLPLCVCQRATNLQQSAGRP